MRELSDKQTDRWTVGPWAPKNEELLEKYNETWDKVSNSIKKRFNSELVHNKKYLGTKIKSYEGKISTYFHGDKTPKDASQSSCLS